MLHHHTSKLNNLIKEILPKIIEIRHQLHQIPELKYEEFKTSALIINQLKAFGYTDISNLAKTGVVALLDTGKPGKTIALRADIDALPIQETADLPYKSQHTGIMHACGHDGHTATLLLTAYILQKMKANLIGKIKLIFQPAEEGGKGSLAMIDEGVLENPAVDAIFAWHVWPGLELGKIGTRHGTILAGNGRFEIELHGRIAHTSMPQHAINPVTIGAQLINALDKLQVYYREHGTIINIIRFECGEIKGGMTDYAKITGVYYIESDEILTKLKLDIQNAAEKIATLSGASINSSFFPFHTPTINTYNETEHVLNVLRKYMPSNKVIEFPSLMIAAEDFSEYLRRVPGCFFLVGAGENFPPVHTHAFNFPDELLSIASLALYQITKEMLSHY